MKRIGLFVGLAVAAFVAYVGVPVLLRQPAPARAPWEGPPLAEIAHEDIRIPGPDIDIGALVFAPDAPQAVVTVIHGSGPSRREHGWYTRLAEALTARNVALVLPDKRGSEQSGGDWRVASMEVLANDAATVFDYAAARWPTLPVGVLGASQGGWIAPILAGIRSDLAFVINQSGAAVPAHEQLTFEEVNTIAEIGVPRPVARLLAPVTAWNIRERAQKPTWDAIGNFDPLVYWSAVTQPALVIYGALDRFDNVPVKRSVDRLTGLGKDNIRVVVLDGLGHSMNRPGSGAIDPRFLDLVARMALVP